MFREWCHESIFSWKVECMHFHIIDNIPDIEDIKQWYRIFSAANQAQKSTYKDKRDLVTYDEEDIFWCDNRDQQMCQKYRNGALWFSAEKENSLKKRFSPIRKHFLKILAYLSMLPEVRPILEIESWYRLWRSLIKVTDKSHNCAWSIVTSFQFRIAVPIMCSFCVLIDWDQNGCDKYWQYKSSHLQYTSHTGIRPTRNNLFLVKEKYILEQPIWQ